MKRKKSDFLPIFMVSAAIAMLIAAITPLVAISFSHILAQMIIHMVY